jgi:hypothetical protein
LLINSSLLPAPEPEGRKSLARVRKPREMLKNTLLPNQKKWYSVFLKAHAGSVCVRRISR